MSPKPHLVDDTCVTVRRTPKDSLKILHCPFCGSEHWHGAGGDPGPDYGHRVAHCFPENVPVHLRERYERGYFLREES